MNRWLTCLTLSLALGCADSGLTNGDARTDAPDVTPDLSAPTVEQDPTPLDDPAPVFTPPDPGDDAPVEDDDPISPNPDDDLPEVPAPYFGEWFRGLGSPGPAWARTVASDSEGNVYIAGTFDSEISFAATVLTAVPGDYEPRVDTFVASFAPTGEFRWMRSFGSNESDLPAEVVVDAEDNVYVVGSNQGDITFDATTLAGKGSEDVYVVSYDREGEFRWAESFGGPFGESPRSAAINSAGQLVITGSYQGLFLAGTTTLSSTDDWAAMEVFTMVFDTTSRRVEWAKGFHGFLIDTGTAVDIAEDGSVVVGVSLQYDLDLDGGATVLDSAGDDFDAALVKLDSQGAIVWVTELEGGESDAEEVLDVVIGDDGSVYATGVFEDVLTLGDFELRNGASRAHDTWVAAFDSAGKTKWAKSYGKDGFDQPLGIALGVHGLYVTGRFDGDIEFESTTLQAVGEGYDIFVSSYEADGTQRWARSIGSEANDQPSGVVADHGRGVYVAGYASGAVMFNDTMQPTAGGPVDAFVLRLEEE